MDMKIRWVRISQGILYFILKFQIITVIIITIIIIIVMSIITIYMRVKMWNNNAEM